MNIITSKRLKELERAEERLNALLTMEKPNPYTVNDIVCLYQMIWLIQTALPERHFTGFMEGPEMSISVRTLPDHDVIHSSDIVKLYPAVEGIAPYQSGSELMSLLYHREYHVTRCHGSPRRIVS